MPRFISHAPVLLVTDLVKSADYFRDCVGFAAKLYGEPPHFAILERDDIHLMLAKAENPADIRPYWKIVHQMWNAYWWVDDAQAMYDELKARGAKIDYELA